MSSPATQKGKKRIPLVPLKQKLSFLIIAIILISLYIAAAARTNTNFNTLIKGLPLIYDFFVNDMYPPNLAFYKQAGLKLLETWNMALLSTTAAAIICLPFCFLAASNLNKNRFVYQGVRFFLNVLRTIPEVILAIIFVGIVGLGAVSGILALIVFSIGILAKLISETIEAIDPGPLEAIRATGGNIIQVIWYGVMPQILPHYTSYSLYVLEINVRASIVLGFVGAGGIGQLIMNQLGWLRYDNLSLIILMTFAAVLLIDYISTRIRESLV
jgi:phosphonate transport system permease protein